MSGGMRAGGPAVAAAEFPRPVALESVPDEGLDLALEAEAAERAAVARRLGLEAVSRLELTGCLRRQGGSNLYRLTGMLRAEVVQTCVVSLEPLEARLEVALDRGFLVAEPEEGAAPEAEVEIEGDDPPDAVPGGVADLGEVAVEELALALDPYPRRPGAELPAALPDGDGEAGDGEGGDEDGPFSVLRRLKH